MIQFITHSNERYDHVEGAKLALQGGCRSVSYTHLTLPTNREV